ncbi:MAG: prolipoprotein diacylglyceryl transferase, partial [Phycisphaerales bacterium]|nr:prolipoprotein diacylglyceryl transferase [Phycisphaerales bacterium]
IPQERVYDAMVWLVLGTIAGGRLGYALVYDRPLLYTFGPSFPFWSLLAINQGGMASHGGMVGLALACWRISRGWRDDAGRPVGQAPVLHIMDCAALVAPFGIFFGRIANFINGELLGKIVTPPGTPGPWWSVQYPQELLDRAKASERLIQTPEQWTQIDALAEIAAPGQELPRQMSVLAHSYGRYQQELAPLLSSRHPSQIYQALAEGLIVALILWLVWLKPRKAGLMTALFLIIYGVLRILTEFIRLPDAQLAVQRIAGLSRGQWLSVGMLVVGGLVLAWVQSRPRPRFGGWLGPVSKP